MRLVFLACLLLSACALQRGRISTPQGTVVGVKDGTPAKFDSVLDTETLSLPVGTTIITTRTEAQPAVLATETTPGREAAPARTEQRVVLSEASTIRRERVDTHADTGSPDATIAKARIQAEQNRWLLWAAIACVPIAIFFVYIKYPTPALYVGAAGVLFFIAWQVAGLPEWVKFVGFGGLIAGVVMWRAHERGLKNADSAGMKPDTPEPKQAPTVP